MVGVFRAVKGDHGSQPPKVLGHGRLDHTNLMGCDLLAVLGFIATQAIKDHEDGPFLWEPHSSTRGRRGFFLSGPGAEEFFVDRFFKRLQLCVRWFDFGR